VRQRRYVDLRNRILGLVRGLNFGSSPVWPLHWSLSASAFNECHNDSGLVVIEAIAYYGRAMSAGETVRTSRAAVFAASDIRSLSQGGSQTKSTWASVMPGSCFSLLTTSTGRL
jgi:hypothetical protein